MFLFLLLIGSLIPTMLLFIGEILRKHPPRTISWYLGYRTARSMKSQEAWDYAQSRLGQLWRRLGLPLWIFSLLILLPFRDAPEDLQGLVLLVLTGGQLVALLSGIPRIEQELQERFREDRDAETKEER